MADKMAKVNDQTEIKTLTDCMVKQLSPVKIYLFGSFAEGRQNADSDYDFYIVVDDSKKDMVDLTAKAYKAIRFKQNRSVDIIVNTEDHFNRRKDLPTLENEVNHKGIVLYG